MAQKKRNARDSKPQLGFSTHGSWHFCYANHNGIGKKKHPNGHGNHQGRIILIALGKKKRCAMREVIHKQCESPFPHSTNWGWLSHVTLDLLGPMRPHLWRGSDQACENGCEHDSWDNRCRKKTWKWHDISMGIMVLCKKAIWELSCFQPPQCRGSHIEVLRFHVL